MNVAELSPVVEKQDTEHQFYALYDWCLNPYLSFEDLLRRLNEELERYPSLVPEWQREESMINIYLFVCAIGCVIDDFRSRRRWNVYPLKKKFPRLKSALTAAGGALNIPFRVSRFSSRARLLRVKVSVDGMIDRVCMLLAKKESPRPDQVLKVKSLFDSILLQGIPRQILRNRMKLNEGFRCQDLTHFDVFLLMEKLLAAGIEPNSPVGVLGLRSAGSYFAPLAASYLSLSAPQPVSWLTIRPKDGLDRRERAALQRWQAASSQVFVVDDYPNSGESLKLTFDALRSQGIRPEKITFLVPRHPMETGWLDRIRTQTGVKIIVLEQNELYKRRLLDIPFQENILREYFGKTDTDNFAIVKNPETEMINAKLRSHEGESFQARMKYVYDVHRRRPDGEDVGSRILLKSVGWGWLGYHAYIIANRMSSFVPKYIGLRNGFLYSEWMEREDTPTDVKSSLELAGRMGHYIGTRVKRLHLDEDPRFASRDYGWGWLELLAIVRRAYGSYLGRLIDRKLIALLGGCIQKVPTHTDGRMRAEDWIHTQRGAVKVDFEQHTFGAPELDIVDPAHDLAGAAFEFDMSKEDEEKMLQAYKASSGDDAIDDRLLLYKILYGTIVGKHSAEETRQRQSREGKERANSRYTRARTFLAKTMNDFVSGALPKISPVEWTRNVFVMDLDGVFDAEILGFPHTTISGLQALATLQTNGWAIVLNTGRSVEHVRAYCRAYNLHGGIAEFGSVFVDAVQGRELPLIEGRGYTQLEKCRERLKELDDVFIDPEYRYSVRAYRFRGHRTEGLSRKEIKEFLARHNFESLSAIFRDEDTYFVQRNIGKEAGSRFLAEYLRHKDPSLVAMGDSDEDIGMLRWASRSFVPGNGSRALKRAARANRWTIFSERSQRALLNAARETVRSRSGGQYLALPDGERTVANLMFHLLDVADKPKLKRILFP
ncbi:MAG TPA: HAD hydrolase family protein [Bacteroidota bacterium]|nr:HAD hydrolase family protein [Bacteroidota bacterium]